MQSSPIEIVLPGRGKCDFIEVLELSNGPFLFCNSCHHIVGINWRPTGSYYPISSPRNLLRKHIRIYHRDIRTSEVIKWATRRPRIGSTLQASFDQMPAAPPNYSPPMITIPIKNGYQCKICPATKVFFTISERGIKQHLFLQHPELALLRRKGSRSPVAHHCFRVQMQTWFCNTVTGLGIWWIVGPVLPFTDTTPNRSKIDEELFTDSTLAGTQPQDDWTPFHKETNWPNVFQQRPYWKALRTLTYLPKLQIGLQIDDESDTSGELKDMHFDTQKEAVLSLILSSQTRIFERCRTTLATTPVVYCQWLQSYHAEKFSQNPYVWKSNPATSRAYLGLWKRLLALVFRAYQMPYELEDRVAFVFHWVTDEQGYLIEQVWNYAYSIFQRTNFPLRTGGPDVELDWLCRQGSSYNRQLDECLMELNISLIQSRNSSFSAPNQTLLVYFIGVLSLDVVKGSPSNLLFITPSSSTSLLSNMIWISRLFILEFALPKEAYLAPRWPCRTSYKNPLRHLQHIRNKYLIISELTPIGELCRLRALGRRLRDRDIGQCMLYWTDDNSMVRVGAESLRMDSFQKWIRHTVAIGELQIQDLIGGFPVAKLPLLSSLQDKISCRDPGMSFLTLPANLDRIKPITDSFFHYMDDVIQTSRMVTAFLKRHDTFLDTLLLLLYQTSGQPARGPEILSIKIYNITSAIRNIFIYEGNLVWITTYNKKGAGTYLPFFIIRFLPANVSLILYYYLTLIWPFARFIRRQYSRALPKQPCYLWPVLAKPEASLSLLGKGKEASQPTSSIESEGVWQESEIESENSNSTIDAIPEMSQSTVDSDSDASSYIVASDSDNDCTETEDEWEANITLSDTDDFPTRSESIDDSKANKQLNPQSSLPCQGFWNTNKLTTLLRHSSRTANLSMTFSVASFRQIAIGITKTHLHTKWFQIPKESPSNQSIHQMFAWQAGHSIAQEEQSYGLNGDFPNRLQPSLFRRYKDVSVAWHQWLGLDNTSIRTREIKDSQESSLG